MRVSQAVVEMLKRHGVEVVFGVPGDTSIELYDAFREASGDIRHVMCRDERSASFMADVYARLTQKPGVCEGPSGGGATYIIPGVAEAHHSSVPLISLCTDIPRRWAGFNVLTEFDQCALFEPLTKWRALLERPEHVGPTFRRAFRVATSGRGGGVHVVLPKDVLAQEFSGTLPDADAECTSFPAYRTRPDPRLVERAAELLSQAQRPVMICGGGAVISGAFEEVAALAEALDIPVATSITGKGSISERHPLSLGVVGDNGGREYAHDFLVEADLLFYVGCRADSTTTVFWSLPPLDTGKVILQLDVDGREVGNSYVLGCGLVGDAKLGLSDLLTALRARGEPKRRGSAERIARRGQEWWAEAQAKMRSDAFPLKPQRIIGELIRTLPPRGVLVVDPGSMTPFTAALFKIGAGRSVVVPRAFGALGYALPGVVGAKVARPDSPVVGLIGDGSFGMAVGEMETITRLRLPVTIVHFNNRTFGWIRVLQKLYTDERYFDVDFCSDVDHAAVARGFGWRGIRVEKASELGPALEEAFRSARATFIDVATQPETEEVPPVHRWLVQAGLCAPLDSRKPEH
jgi:acetolactate synthase-1/2/3 large subunit